MAASSSSALCGDEALPMGIAIRYGVYGAVTMLTLATYVLWNEDGAPPAQGPSLRAGGDAILPALNLMDSRG